MYDPATPPPFAESAPTRPRDPYGQARLEMERRLIAGAGDVVRPVSIRVSNAYGPGQRLGRGQGVIGHWLAAAVRGEPLRVFGDPGTIRDYVFVDDVADAMRKLLSPPRRCLRCSTSDPVRPPRSGSSSTSSARRSESCEVIFESARSFDDHDTWLDVRLAAETIDWVPSTSLEDGLRRTWAHVRDQGQQLSS